MPSLKAPQAEGVPIKTCIPQILGNIMECICGTQQYFWYFIFLMPCEKPTSKIHAIWQHCLLPLPSASLPTFQSSDQLAYGISISTPALPWSSLQSHSIDPSNAIVCQSFTPQHQMASNSSTFCFLLPWIIPRSLYSINPPPRNLNSVLINCHSETPTIFNFTLLILPIYWDLSPHLFYQVFNSLLQHLTSKSRPTQ